MGKHFRGWIGVFALVFAFSTTEFGASAPDEPRTPAEKIEYITRVTRGSSQLQDSEILLKFFSDPDGKVRRAATQAIFDTKTTRAAVLMKLVDLSESDPSPEVRADAINLLEYFVLARSPKSPNVLNPSIVTELIKFTQSKDASERRRAVAAMGEIGAGDADSVKAYADLLQDKEVSVRRAAVIAIANLVEHLQGGQGNDFKPALIKALRDDSIRDASGLAVYMAFERLWLPEAGDIAKTLMQSSRADDRGIGAVITARMYEMERRLPSARSSSAKLVSVELLNDAVRSGIVWVRAAAAEQAGPNFQNLHLSAVQDPNPDVARDAVLRLAGELPPRQQLSFRGMRIALKFPGAATQRAQMPSVLGIPSGATAAQKLQAINAAAGMARQGGPALQELAVLFADPDKKVQTAARDAAQAILRATLPATRPATMRGI